VEKAAKIGMENKRSGAYTYLMSSGNFKNICVSAIFAVLIIQAVAPVNGIEEAPDPLVLDQERRLKEDAEHQAQTICDSILGKGKSSILVNVELGLESSRKGGAALNQKRDQKNSLGDSNFILPWVPAPKSVSKEEVPKDASVETQAAQQTTIDVKTVLKRFDITVVHDETIPEDRIELTKETLKAAFDRYKAILKLLFRPTSYVAEKTFDPKETVRKNLFDSINFKNFLLFFLLLLGLWLLKFFFGPLTEFMKEYIQGMKEQSKSRVEMENKSETENETDENAEENLEELTPEELAELQAQEAIAMEEKFEPFNYINDENIKQLAYLLHHEEPWIVALVMSYLSAEHAYKVMEALPPELQAKVALETAMYRQTSLDQVRAINEDIKEKIDFVVGGLDKLVGILESSDRFARDNILEYLKNEKPGLYEKVRERILLFEDIANFPKQAMQFLVRELKIEDLGKALRNTSPELQQKFFENMSQGAVALLKEEIEFGRPVTNDQIEDERRKIVDLIKKMEEEGKVSFRQKGLSNALTSDVMGAQTPSLNLNSALGGAGKKDSAQAMHAYESAVAAADQQNYDEAIRQFQSSLQADPSLTVAHQGLANALYAVGRYQEALASYEHVLELEPNSELQTWVEELRTSLSTAA